MKALMEGRSRNHMRLWDNQWRLIWDSTTATTPAYQHISDRCNATIDYPDGQRWSGIVYRCPEGIQRWSHEDLSWLTCWPNPFLEES